MPQQVPITNSEQLQETKQQVEEVGVERGDAQKHLKSMSSNEPKSNENNKTNASVTVASTLQQKINASSNCNLNNNNNSKDDGAANGGTNTSALSNSNHDNFNANNSNNNVIKPTTKLNGLKNRIIQRPPPLILDKVSNFYDNETINNGGQQTLINATASVITTSTSSGQIINCDNYVTKNHQNQLEAAINKSNTNLVDQHTNDTNHHYHQQQQLGDESNNNQLNNNVVTSANQKFWASLNENASRNKALANARNTNATKDQSDLSKSKQESKDTNGSSSVTLEADLIISHRNSSGTLSTSQIISSSSNRRQSLTSHTHHHKQKDETHENQDNKQTQHHNQQSQQSLHFPNEIPNFSPRLKDIPEYNQRHNISNNSTEPDDGPVPSDIDGGNLIGVDNCTPPAFDNPRLNHHHHQLEEPPASATSRRSNNPFLDPEDEDEINSQQSLRAQQLPLPPNNAFYKRPASFIAATEKVASANRSSAFMNQQVVEEQFNQLHLDDQLYSTRPMHANPVAHNAFQPTDAILINQQLDQRDSTAAQFEPIKSTQQHQQKLTSQYLPITNQSQPIYGFSNGYNSTNNTYPDQAISLDSENAICQPPPSATMQLPHWTDAIYELKYATLEVSSVAGGAENGQFIYIIETGDIVLEIDQIKVSGLTLLEFTDLIESKQFLLRAVQTKHSRGLTLDLKHYLNMSFPKNSEDKQLQNLIRENIYRRTIPCTTRPPKPGEIDKVDYHFVTKEAFVDMNNKGILLECGVYSDHYYGTMKPFCDLNSTSSIYNSANQDQTPSIQIQQEQQQQWDANHPAIDVKKDPASFQHQTNMGNIVDHPLYENHESMNLQRLTTNNFEIIANQNGLQLESMIPPNGLKQSSIVAVDSESLPPGWERVIDQTHGTYYIDHNTQRTQYERPYEIELTKGQMGFGFTLVEADNGLLLVRSVIPGGPAHSNGLIKPGDILVSAVGVSVTGLEHTGIARLFSTFAVGDRVRLTFARSAYVVDDSLVPDEYLFSNGTNGDLAIAVNANNYYDSYLSHNMPTKQQMQLPSPHILVNQEFEFVSVELKRGDQGFGFTISDSIAGQKVRKIQNHEICSNLKQGDILTVLNDEDITKLTHKEVVEKLKRCQTGQDVTLTVKRRKRFRSKTPMAMHTDQTSSLGSTPQRNCKTPSLDGIMLKRPINYNSHDLPVSRNLFSTTTAATTTSNIMANDSQHHSSGFPANGLPGPQLPLNQTPAASGLYAPFSHHNRPQPIIPQPIYGSIAHQHPQQVPSYEDQATQEPYYGQQQQSLPPLPSHVSDFDLNRPKQVNRPASIPSSDGNLTHANLTNSAHPSRPLLPPPLPATKPNPNYMNGLSQLNQYNNFMNNDKLVMMQMQQQKYNQTVPPPSQHQPQTIMMQQVPSDYHQMPLYSNSEVLNTNNSRPTGPMLPQVPIKPPMNQYMSNLYGTQMINSQQLQNNLYANNEEISILRAQYDDQYAAAQQPLQPVGDHFAFMPSSIQQHYASQTPLEEQDEYEYHSIDLDRDSRDSNWGIRLIGGAEVDRAISIGSIVFGGAASKNGLLKSGDEIISINDVNVVGATHQHVVELISACTNRASLVIRRKKFAEACEVVLTRNPDEGFGFVIISSGNCALIGRIIDGSPADRCQQLHVRDRIIAVNGRYITPNMQHPEIVNMIKDCGSMLKLRIIPIDCYTVELIKNSKNDNFGFSMRGGSEYDGTPLYILRVAPNGLARDLLNVGDQILEINNIPTVGMTHQQAAYIIKCSDPIVKLKLRRNYVTPPSLLVDSPRALQRINSVTAEMSTVNLNVTPNTFMNDATSTVSSDLAGALVVNQVGGSFNSAPVQNGGGGGAAAATGVDMALGSLAQPAEPLTSQSYHQHQLQQPISSNGTPAAAATTTTTTTTSMMGKLGQTGVVAGADLTGHTSYSSANNQSLPAPLYAT